MSRREEIDPGLLPVIDEVLKSSPTRYVQAWIDRLAWWQQARAFFERWDLLLCPAVSTAAFELGILWPTEVDGKSVDREAGSAFTFPFNMTGQPAASVPCGFTKGGLPIGLQIVGRRFADVTVLRAAAAFERARPWAQHRPPVG
jgi:aspartyl-tRNA(Asn)/glutamyl-tRNA(Gln) amidotransferase subunit A